MERGPFLSKPVQKEFRRFVEILLYTDGGEQNRSNRDFQKERFGTFALPYYAALDPTGTRVLWQAGGAHTAEEFAASLKGVR